MLHWFRVLLTAVGLLAAVGLAIAAPLALKVDTALASFDEYGQPVVNIRLDEESARAFAGFTAENIGKVVELRVDGEIVTAPMIRDTIAGGEIMISGSMTAEDAASLAMRLRGGGMIEVAVTEGQ